MLSLISTMKFAEIVKGKSLNPVEQRREKLVRKLDEQLSLAKAMLAGEDFSVTKRKWVTDPSGEKKLMDVRKLLKAWYWKDEAGQLLMSVRYGAKLLEFQPGKAAILVGEQEKLPQLIQSLIEAARAGELDGAIGAVLRDSPFPAKPSKLPAAAK